MKYVVFDIETTGLNTSEDRIIEIGAVNVIDGVIVEEFSKLINPLIPIPYQAYSVNGITDDMVKDAPFPGLVFTEFSRFIEGVDFLVGHNANRFDYPFLQAEFDRYFVKHSKLPLKDTLWLARNKLRGLRSYSLKNLCIHYNIVNEDAHRALSDALATQKIFDLVY